MIKVIVFDVNETLLDLSPLNIFFQNIFGDPTITSLWFSKFIQTAFVTTITQNYSPFGEIGLAVLTTIAAMKGVQLTLDQQKEFTELIKNLPPHPEVKQSLQKLRQQGFQLATLTNSTQEVMESQLKNAKIDRFFDYFFSADKVKKLKPAEEPYKMVAEELKVSKDEILLVAAHDWDIAGALNSGLAAAFISRPGKFLTSLFPKPLIVAKDLQDFVSQIDKIQAI